jgi:hypothetical protein
MGHTSIRPVSWCRGSGKREPHAINNEISYLKTVKMMDGPLLEQILLVCLINHQY